MAKSRSQEDVFVALYDYTSDLPRCMCIKEGDKLEIVDKKDPVWWVVQSLDGTMRCTVPKNILARQEDLQEPWLCLDVNEDQVTNALFLLEEGQGAFLIRPTNEHFTLYVRDGYEVKKFKINKNHGGKMGLKNKKKFPSLVALVSHYHEDVLDLGVELSEAVDQVKVISLIEENKRRLSQWQPSNKPKENVIKPQFQPENKRESEAKASEAKASEGTPSGKTKRRIRLNTDGGPIVKKQQEEGNSIVVGELEDPCDSACSSQPRNSLSPPEKEIQLGPGESRVNTRGGIAILNQTVGNDCIMVNRMTPSIHGMIDTFLHRGEKQESGRPTLPRPKLEDSDTDDDTIYDINTGGGLYIGKQVIKGNGLILNTRRIADAEPVEAKTFPPAPTDTSKQ